MKKALCFMLAILLMFSLCSCRAQQLAEPVTPAEPPKTEQPAEPAPAEPSEEAVLTQVNIYHLGIKTALNIEEEQAIALADQLMSLLANAAETDSMEAPAADAINPIQATSWQTALEVIYNQDMELPLSDETTGEPLTARMLLYSIPLSSSDGGLLFTGQDIYMETPLGILFNQTLQNAIYNSACDQVERVVFDAEGQQVLINGQEYAYVGNDDSAELSGHLLNRILYRSIAFYFNSFTGNINGLQAMSTSSLYAAVLKAKEGQTTEEELGEQTIVNLNKYVLAEYFFPQSIEGPLKQGKSADEYAVVFTLNEKVSLTLNFVVEEDTPLVSSLELAMAD